MSVHSFQKKVRRIQQKMTQFTGLRSKVRKMINALWFLIDSVCLSLSLSVSLSLSL